MEKKAFVLSVAISSLMHEIPRQVLSEVIEYLIEKAIALLTG